MPAPIANLCLNMTLIIPRFPTRFRQIDQRGDLLVKTRRLELISCHLRTLHLSSGAAAVLGVVRTPRRHRGWQLPTSPA